ncbi:hypothetical protein E2562_035141 [Oryza meyeriana var. granulata]|uniref:Serine/threonine-protein kinase BSK1-like TPR repeats domain-containing protein n=1 Tax=Oryza meyeriana var. granulata TaxID=110450 RepID=A0A6G1F1L6_9ORYZ|nr:hypothetical protein E2562_035141 [Oryza meyeriana var. granulata]
MEERAGDGDLSGASIFARANEGRTGSGDRELGLGNLAAATVLFLVSELHRSRPNSVSNTVTLIPVKSSHPAVLAPLVGLCLSGTVVVDGASGRTGKEVMEKLLERGTASELTAGRATGLGAPHCPLSCKSCHRIEVVRCTVAACRSLVRCTRATSRPSPSPGMVLWPLPPSCQLSFVQASRIVYDSILVKKHGDSAFQSKDFATAVECYSRFIDTGAMVSPTMLEDINEFRAKLAAILYKSPLNKILNHTEAATETTNDESVSEEI